MEEGNGTFVFWVKDQVHIFTNINIQSKTVKSKRTNLIQMLNLKYFA